MVGLNYFLEELKRREQRRFNRCHISLSVFSLIIAISAVVVEFMK